MRARETDGEGETEELTDRPHEISLYTGQKREYRESNKKAERDLYVRKSSHEARKK